MKELPKNNISEYSILKETLKREVNVKCLIF